MKAEEGDHAVIIQNRNHNSQSRPSDLGLIHVRTSMGVFGNLVPWHIRQGRRRGRQKRHPTPLWATRADTSWDVVLEGTLGYQRREKSGSNRHPWLPEVGKVFNACNVFEGKRRQELQQCCCRRDQARLSRDAKLLFERGAHHPNRPHWVMLGHVTLCRCVRTIAVNVTHHVEPCLHCRLCRMQTIPYESVYANGAASVCCTRVDNG